MLHSIGRYGILSACLVLFTGMLVDTRSCSAQKLDRGFDLLLPASATGPETNAQADLWLMEVRFKPMRMIQVKITDPKTKQQRIELIWYLVYRAINRPIPRRVDNSDTQPINAEDVLPAQLFAPEFALVTDDNGKQMVYADVVLPEAQAAIIARERMDLKNTIEIVQPVPSPTPVAAETQQALDGVVMWRNIDPKTDFFSVYMSGFSNGYRISAGPEGKPLLWRKTIVHEYWRPGDEVDEREREIRRRDEPALNGEPGHEPRWMYRADSEIAAHPQDLPRTETARPAAGNGEN